MKTYGKTGMYRFDHTTKGGEDREYVVIAKMFGAKLQELWLTVEEAEGLGIECPNQGWDLDECRELFKDQCEALPDKKPAKRASKSRKAAKRPAKARSSSKTTTRPAKAPAKPEGLDPAIQEAVNAAVAAALKAALA